MAVGHKTGGRAAGTPNRKTQEVAELLESLGCDPIAGMASIAGNERNPPELRGRMYAELAQYVHPKRKSVDANITGADGVAPQVTFIIRPVGPPEQEEVHNADKSGL